MSIIIFIIFLSNANIVRITALNAVQKFLNGNVMFVKIKIFMNIIDKFVSNCLIWHNYESLFGTKQIKILTLVEKPKIMIFLK